MSERKYAALFYYKINAHETTDKHWSWYVLHYLLFKCNKKTDIYKYTTLNLPCKAQLIRF